MTLRSTTPDLDEGRISFGDPERDTSDIDPVCGSTVDRREATTVSASHGSDVYHFCSLACKQRFLLEPATYV